MVVVLGSGCVRGLTGFEVRVEISLYRRLPKVIIVGLAAGAVRESTERVRSAILASGFEFPRMCVTINLAPGDVKKEGTGLDLPIALGILVASGQLERRALGGCFFVGELSLDGEIRRVQNPLSLAMLAKRQGYVRIVVPTGCGAIAAHVSGIEVCEATSLSYLVESLRLSRILPVASPGLLNSLPVEGEVSDVDGQSMAKRALELAAAGGHNLMLVGPPGVGKTMIARRLPCLLPSLGHQEAVEVTLIHSAAGFRVSLEGLVSSRPFRVPHHSITRAGMIGNARLVPGELSLAHCGVLFLDELPEFQRSVLELLRGPLQDREVVISRAEGVVRFPASCILVATANPCPCGFLGHPFRPCSCTEIEVHRYRGRVSGPLMDRVDLHVQMEAVPYADPLASRRTAADLRRSVAVARAIQASRYDGEAIHVNAELEGGGVRRFIALDCEASRRIEQAVVQFSFSARSRDRILKVARTIADLAGSSLVHDAHVAEALLFRGVDQVAL